MRRDKKELYGDSSCVGLSAVFSCHLDDDTIFHDPREYSLFSGFELIYREITGDDCPVWISICIFLFESFVEPVESFFYVCFVTIDGSHIVIDDRLMFCDGFEWKKFQSARVFFRSSKASISSNYVLFKVWLIYKVSTEYLTCEIGFPDSYTA